VVLGRREEMEQTMAVRRILIRILEFLVQQLEILIERLDYSVEMRLWEIQKRNEGFPTEWFEEE
jgi:hypothetical protein